MVNNGAVRINEGRPWPLIGKGVAALILIPFVPLGPLSQVIRACL